MVRKSKSQLSPADQELVNNIPMEEDADQLEGQTATRAKKVRTGYYLVMAEQRDNLDWVVLQRLKSRKAAMRYVEQVRTILRKTFATVRIVRSKTVDEEYL